MTHCTYRSRVRVGHQTATGPVTPTCSWDRWGRAETERTALGEALVMRRRTRVRFPPPPPRGLGETPCPLLAKSRGPPRTAVAPALRRLGQWRSGCCTPSQRPPRASPCLLRVGTPLLAALAT